MKTPDYWNSLKTNNELHIPSQRLAFIQAIQQDAQAELQKQVDESKQELALEKRQDNSHMQDLVTTTAQRDGYYKTILAQSLVIRQKDEALKRIWNEDECGWITRDDQPDSFECGKCGKQSDTKESVVHEEYCTQGFIYKTLSLTNPDTEIASLEQDKAILDWLDGENIALQIDPESSMKVTVDVIQDNALLDSYDGTTIRQACLKAMKGNE